jgi:hypothetical protein
LIKRSGPASQGLPQPILRIGVAVFFEERQGEAHQRTLGSLNKKQPY